MTSLTRRDFAAALAALGVSLPLRRAAAAQPENGPASLPPEHRAEYEAYVARMWAAFPYEHVTVPGADALAEWERLRAAGGGTPIVSGGDEGLAAIAEQFTMLDPQVAGTSAFAGQQRTPAEILKAAAALRFPGDLANWPGASREEDLRTPLGDWPPESEAAPGLTIATDLQTGQPLDRVHILQLPAATSWEVPAWLRWGDWNACPPPEHHVAALRSWHERYGAELVAIDRDTMNLRVRRRPSNREEALALAREQYRCCPDIVDQGVGSLSALAAGLMAGDWWFFWWD